MISNAPNPANRTGEPTSGSAIISGLSSTSDLYPGMPVSGTGIPAGATILAIDSSSSITLSLPATAGDGATAEGISFQSANGLTISGSGQTILTGANTYTGPTTVGGGTLQVGDGTSSSSIGPGPVINDATLALDPGPSGLALANSINGTGTLVKIGSGTLVLSGTSGYSGGTTVSGGIVRFASAAALPASGQISIASGAYAGTVADANTSGFLNDVATSSTGVLGLDGATNGLDLRTPGFSDSLRVGSSTSGTLSGTFIPPGNTYRVGGGGGRLVIASNLNDAGGLETNLEMGTSGSLPAGAVILEGIDTYSGSTLIDGGTLILTSGGSLPAHTPLTIDPGCTLIFDPLAGPSQFSGSATWTSSSGSAWNNAANWTDNNGRSGVPGVAPRPSATDTATFSGSGSVTAIDLTGVDPSLKALTFSTSSYTLSGGSLSLQGNSGPATVTVSGTQSIGSMLTLAGSADMIVTNSSDRLTLSGQVVGTGGLLKDGAGTLVLSGGANTYGGGTVVNAGTLMVTSSVALPAGTNVTIGPGGTLIFDPLAGAAPSFPVRPPGLPAAASPGTTPPTGPTTAARAACRALPPAPALRTRPPSADRARSPRSI